jgi:hypothetical protein
MIGLSGDSNHFFMFMGGEGGTRKKKKINYSRGHFIDVQWRCY